MIDPHPQGERRDRISYGLFISWCGEPVIVLFTSLRMDCDNAPWCPDISCWCTIIYLRVRGRIESDSAAGWKRDLVGDLFPRRSRLCPPSSSVWQLDDQGYSRVHAHYRLVKALMMRTGGMLDGREFGKRVRRLLDGNYSYRKILLIVLVCGGLLLYFGPSFAQWLFSTAREPIEGNFILEADVSS